MSAAEVYDASPLKRHRSTKAEMAEFRRAIWNLTYGYKPLTGRQLYYRAAVAGLIEKDEGGSRASEQRVGKAIGYMRERYVEWMYDHDGGDLQLLLMDLMDGQFSGMDVHEDEATVEQLDAAR